MKPFINFLAFKYLSSSLLTSTLRAPWRACSTVELPQTIKQPVQQPTPLARQLAAKIKATGPLTVADYMKEVLVNPASGYYSHKDSIGAEGDFITSPELSQLFGEMVAVWILNEWQKVGSPRPLQLVELGPGRGTLMQDVLRVLAHLKQLEGVSVHLVELSARLQSEQLQRLCEGEALLGTQGPHNASATASVGCPVMWYHALCQVPTGSFTCVLAHEFFDALPIHKLQKSDKGWREVLIDIDPANTEEITFRNIISRSATPACHLFTQVEEHREHLEVCPEGGALMQAMAKRFEEDGGFLLMADYGHDGTGTDTFRGFSKHQLHDPLNNPGSADLTADVDFSFLRSSVKGKALTFGPVTQQHFLSSLGIELRLKVLLQSPVLSEEARATLQKGLHLLTSPDHMGARFKFFSMFPLVLEDHLRCFPVAGFGPEKPKESGGKPNSEAQDSV